MPRHHRLISRLLCAAALVPGCIVDSSGSDTQGGATTTATTSTTASSLSGSATSASGGTASDSTPTTTTTTTSGADSTGNPWTSEPCGVFLACDDMPSSERQCDNFAQDCPEGQKCAAYSSEAGPYWDALKCVDVTGTDGPGDPCTVDGLATGIDSCVEGAMCWWLDQEGVGHCIALCTGTPEAPVCENNADCTINGEGTLNVCYPKCDPLAQDCLGSDMACYAVSDFFVCEPDASGPEGQTNDPCEFDTSCDPGLTCTNAGLVGKGCSEAPTGCCTPFCKFPGGACPNPDQQCVQYFDPMQLPPGDPKLAIGVCGISI